MGVKVFAMLRVSLPEEGGRLGYRNVVFFKKLDKGQSTKKRECVIQ